MKLFVRVRKQLPPAGERHDPFALDVSFETESLTSVLFGPSGSGKTTLLRAIAGLTQPDAGRIARGNQIFFDDASATRLPPHRRRLAMVFQEPSLFPHKTALENVLCASKSGVVREADAFLERFRVAHVRDQLPRQLSGGEQQRISIARALASEPELLLLDEPLSAVDTATRASVLTDLLAYQQDENVPMLYVTHDRAEAIGLGGETVLMDAGRVVARGETKTLLTAPDTPAAARVLGPGNVLVGVIERHLEDDGLSQVNVGGSQLATPLSKLPVGSRVAVTLPSDDIIVAREAVGLTSARNILKGTIDRVLHLDSGVELVVKTPAPFRAHISRKALRSLELTEGQTVHLLFKAMAIVVEPTV